MEKSGQQQAEERLITAEIKQPMERKSVLNDWLSRIEAIACTPCSCTVEQQTGNEPSVCRSCTAGKRLNSIAEDIREAMKELNG